MYRITVDDKPYTQPVKKFAVSRDGVLAALVTATNQVLVYKIIDQDQHGTFQFVAERKFSRDCRVYKHPDTYKEVIDLFIFKNNNFHYGDGLYSMYVASTNGILLYEGIDRREVT